MQLPNTKAFLDENGQQQRLYFGSQVTLKKGGAMGGEFALIAPKKLTFLTLKDYAKLSLTVGTGICLGCSAREGSTSDLLVFLSGMIELGPAVAKVEDDNGIIVKGSDGLPAIPSLLFSVNMPSWQKLRIEATLPAKYGVQLTMLPFIGFKSISNGGIQDESTVKDKFLCSTSTKVTGTNIIYDFNERDEDGIDRGDGVKATGLIFKNLSVRLPKELKDTQGKVVKLDVKFLAIGENGVSGEVSTKQQANNYLLNPKIEGIFDLGITEVAIKIEKNQLTKYRIAGDLELPLLSDYGMVFSLEKGEEKITDPITKIQSSNDILSFTAGLKNTSKTINCTLFGTGIEVTGLRPVRGTIPAASVAPILAKGQLNLTTGDFKDFGVVFNYGSFKLLSYSLDFDKIAITTKPPYLEEFALTPTKDGLFEIAGFKFGISSLSIKGDPATKLITGNTIATIDVKNGTNQPIKMTAGLIFQAEVVKNDEGKTKFKFNYFRPEKIHVAADFPTFGFDADLDIFENQSRLGVSNLSGIEGKSKFWFNFMDGGSKTAKEESKAEQEKTKGGAGVYLLFAKDNKNENAWAIDVDVNFPTPGILLVPPPSAPIFLKGVFGGAYSNLKINGDVINKVVGSDKGSRTGLSYTWDPGRWGFNIGLDFSATPTIDVSAMLAVEGKVKEGLSFIKAAGYAKFKVSLNDLLPGVGDKLSEGFNQVINKVNKIPGITEFPTVENLKSLKTTEEIAKGSKKNGEDSFAALFNKVPEDGDGNRIAAGIILALNFENGGLNSLSIKMYPDIHVNLKNLVGNASLASTGYGLLFISRDKKYLHLGSSKQLSDRLGLNFQAGIDAGKAGSLGLKAFVNAYFMLGDDVPITLPAPIVPAIFAAKFASKSNDIISGRGTDFEGGTAENLRNGSGLAFGAAVGVALNLNIAYVFTVDAEVGAGFDALLVNKAACVEGWGGGSGGNGWKAQAQVYGYAAAKVTILSIPIVEFGVGFLLKASVPKPFYAEGYFAAYIRIWKAEVNINIRGKIGDATCPLEKNEKDKVLIKESFTLIDNFTPNNKIGSKPTISTTANLYLKCKYPKDQVGVSGVLGVNKFKQEVIVTLKNGDGSPILDTDGKDKYAFTDATINPKEKLNEAIKISFGKKLDKNTSYKAEVKTRIYTTETYNEPDEEGRNFTTISTNETVHYTKKEGDKIYDVSLEQSEVYSFNTTGEDFNLEESDVLIYPAKNQYNVYKSDFGGSGFLQIDPVVAKKIQGNCTSCDLRVGIYKDGVGVTTAIANITTGTDFLLNVDADQIYEIRVLGTVEGQTKTLYKDHYFRASKNNSFESKVKGIETALKPSWVGTELRFDLLTNSLSPDESFSNEEIGDNQLKKSLSLQISTNKVPSWFQDVTHGWSKVGGQGLNWEEKEIACKQTQYPFLKGNSVDFVKSQDNNSYASPAFIFSTFEQTILQLLKDIAADESGTVGNFIIPKLIEETELCFTIENDISKLSYYDDHSNIQLPARFTKLNAPICFKSPEEVDFMDKSKLERTVTVSCTIGSFDSTPIIYSFEMKSSDGKIIPFPANFAVTASNKPLTVYDRDLNKDVYLQSDEYTNVKDFVGDRNSTGTKQIVSYGSIRKSIDGCPTNTAFSGVGTGISSVSTKFIVNTLEATPIKPCLSIKDNTDESAKKDCIDACKKKGGGTACDYICTSNLYSSEKKFLIESWENNSRLDPQKSRKVISLSFNNKPELAYVKSFCSL